MSWGRGYFFVHEDGVVETQVLDEPRRQIEGARLLDGSWDHERLIFERHTLVAGPGHARRYFYADNRLGIERALEILLSPPHKAMPTTRDRGSPW